MLQASQAASNDAPKLRHAKEYVASCDPSCPSVGPDGMLFRRAVSYLNPSEPPHTGTLTLVDASQAFLPLSQHPGRLCLDDNAC